MKTTAQRNEERRRFIAEMDGQGWIRFHPRTQRWYEIRGQYRCRVAYPHPCKGCGKTVYRSAQHIRKSGLPTCTDCHPRAERAIGTTRQNREGYVYVKTMDGWRLQHRLVMEQAIGRPLEDDETVHHINGNRTDNRITNLQLRRGNHGPGQAHRCLDCGSANIGAVEL